MAKVSSSRGGGSRPRRSSACAMHRVMPSRGSVSVPSRSKRMASMPLIPRAAPRRRGGRARAHRPAASAESGPGAGRKAARASAATFSSGAAIPGSIALAIQPARRRPAARTASAVSSAWLRQPRRSPTTRTTGRPSAAARSLASSAGARGTWKPPTPSTTVKSHCAASRRCASRSGSRRMVRPSRAAAMWGAMGSRSSTGVIASRAGAPGPAASASASVSSLAQAPACGDGAGRHRLHRRHAQAARAQRMDQRAGGESLAHAGVGSRDEHAAAHRGPLGAKLTTWRPSARRAGGTFHACP